MSCFDLYLHGYREPFGKTKQYIIFSNGRFAAKSQNDHYIL